MYIGKCSHCGADIIETEFAYSCSCMGSDYENHDSIWKNALANLGGFPLDRKDAVALFAGQSITVQLQSRRTGRYYQAKAYYDFTKQKVVTYYK